MNAQDYVPFPDSNAVWAMECCQGFQCQEFIWNEHYWVGNEDTLIGGKQYNKLFYYRSGWSIDEYIGAYRNDTILKHVYYVSAPDTSEILLYDFSLGFLDTFQIPYPQVACMSVTDAVLQSMDSVLIGSEYRREFIFSTVRMYEGIGSVAGLFEYYTACFEYQCILRCFKSGDTITLGNPWSCNLATDEIEEAPMTNTTILLQPNPLQSTSSLYLAKESGAETISVYNHFGQKIHARTVGNQPTIRFNRSDYEPGLYILIIQDKNLNVVRHGKFTVM